jgi:uncharacterized protein (TIGR02145 family)
MLLNITKNIAVILLLTFAGSAAFTSCKKETITENPSGRAGGDVDEGDYGEIIIEEKKYSTVKIGNQIWTEANYDGKAGIKLTDAPSHYGKYYTFSEAKAVVLPEGWRLPTENDYYKLLDSQKIKIENRRVINPEEIKRLTSKNHWLHTNGNNKSGFNAQPAGYVIDSQLAAPGILAEFWTANGTTISIQESITVGELKLLFYAGDNSNTNKFNIRFVKDN